jgi:NADPH:quinone reductase-like Zn-dependent oxidoreductase
VILPDFDSEPILDERPTPAPGANEVRVRIEASSVNGFDVSVAEGRVKGMMELELPITLGRDYAGVVDEVGEGVTRHSPGDEVFGFVFKDVLHDGTWADFVVLPEDMFASPKPAGLGFDLAAALPLAGVAAMKAVEAVAPSEGDTVLVVGATGGVGAFAVQLAAARGARVVATAEPADEARLRGLGAAETIDFTSDDVPAVVRERYPEGIQGLIDLVTPADGFAAVAALVRDGGRVATTTGAGDADELGRRGIALTAVWASAEPDTLARLAGHVEEGRLRVELERVYPLAEATEALGRFRGGTHGKIGIAVA